MPLYPDYDYNEATASRSPVQMSIRQDGSRVVCPYLWEPTDVANPLDDLYAAITDIMGDARPKGNGKLERSLPKAHPILPWCFASQIVSITGEGQPTLVTTDVDYEAPLIVGAFASYPSLRLMVEFSTVPFAVLRDSAITVGTTTYYPETDTGSPAAGQTITIASEWDRFCDADYAPSLELAYAQHGTVSFKTSAAVAPPHGRTASGFPKLSVPRATIRWRWFHIPMAYVTGGATGNSYLLQNLGRVNQDTWGTFDPGSLLYTGLTVTSRYPPPIPERTDWTGSASFSAEKLCSVELQLDYTTRTAAAAAPTPVNRNWVAGGHNLLPYLAVAGGLENTAGFLYATRGAITDAASKWKPTYDSCIFAQLFTDPNPTT